MSWKKKSGTLTMPLLAFLLMSLLTRAELFEFYKYMMSYSPYDNIRATTYPHMLITTGLNDPRVAYWEPAKFAARLREMKTDDNLLLLQTNYASGHAGASGRYDNLKEIAVDYAFLIDRLCGHIAQADHRQEVIQPLQLQEAAGIIRQDLSVLPER